MIDYISMVADICKSQIQLNDRNFVSIGEIELFPDRNKRNGEIVQYQTKVQNLLFTLNGTRLRVSNSLHKFQKGNNYSDFRFSEIQSSINQIVKLTGVKADDFEIKKLEFSLNINVQTPPKDYLSYFSNFKRKEYDKMRAGVCWYGNKYILSEYALKIYDKTECTKRQDRITLPDNLLRFELQYLKSRKIPAVRVLSDLRIKENYYALFDEFIDKIKNISCMMEPNVSKLKSRDREIYFASRHPGFMKTENSINRRTCSYKIKRLNMALLRISEKNMIDEFCKNLEKKFANLIES